MQIRGTAGGAGQDRAAGLVMSADATPIIGAQLDSDSLFLGNSVTPKGGQDIFVGAPTWSKQYGSTGVESLVDISIGDSNRVLLLAEYSNAFELEELSALPGPTLGRGFLVASAKASDGTIEWARRAADLSPGTATSVASDMGRIAVAGTFEGDAIIGSSIEMSTQLRPWIQLLGEEGEYLHTIVLGGDAEIAGPVAVALDSSGLVALAFFANAGRITSGSYEDSGQRALVVFVFDSQGKAIWSTRLASLGEVRVRALEFDSAGGLTVAGEFQYGLSLDDDVVTVEDDGYPDSFVARLNRSY